MGQAGLRDLQRGKVWDCRRVDRPHTVTIVFKCHQLRGQTRIAAYSGSISSWDYCLVNECSLFFQPWCVHLSSALSFPRVFIDRAYLLMRSARTHLPSIDITSNSYPVYVLGWIVCVQSTWPLSLLFSLKSCSVAEQKATSRSPPLRVGIVVYLYLRVQVAVVEAAAAPFSNRISVCCHILFFCIKSIWWILRSYSVNETCDCLMQVAQVVKRNNG